MSPLVLFDLDDVLYHYRRPLRIIRLAAATGIAPATIEDRIWSSGFEDEADAGAHGDGDSYLAAFSLRLGAPVDRTLWRTARAASIAPIPASLSMMQALPAFGIRVAILTNNGPCIHEERHALFPEAAETAGADFLTSAALKRRKPDPAIYRDALDRLGARAETTLFVDDLAENVAGAIEAGLAGHCFTGPEGLAAALRQRFPQLHKEFGSATSAAAPEGMRAAGVQPS